jgi:hypothetical protein
MNASEFLKAFPEVKTDYGTGGGCTAWWLDLGGDWFGVLITDGIDACQPTMRATRAAFGFVNEGEGIEPRIMTWAHAADWLRGVLDYRDAARMWGLVKNSDSCSKG